MVGNGAATSIGRATEDRTLGSGETLSSVNEVAPLVRYPRGEDARDEFRSPIVQVLMYYCQGRTFGDRCLCATTVRLGEVCPLGRLDARHRLVQAQRATSLPAASQPLPGGRQAESQWRFIDPYPQLAPEGRRSHVWDRRNRHERWPSGR